MGGQATPNDWVIDASLSRLRNGVTVRHTESNESATLRQKLVPTVSILTSFASLID
jgi:hypothetical protein